FREGAANQPFPGYVVATPGDARSHSEAGRFHRVIALVLVGLAALVLFVELTRHHALAEAGLLSCLLLAFALAARWLARDLRSHPANFPEPSASQGLQFSGAERHD